MSTTTWELTGIVLCLIMSGVFSGSETALTALSLGKLEHLLERYPRWARSLRVWRDNPGEVLTSILIANNIFNITASVLATDIASRLLQDNALAVAIGGMTLLLLLSSEVTPKAFARVYAPQLAPLAMNIAGIFHVLFYPVTWLMTHIINAMMFFFGKYGQVNQNHVITAEDLNYMLRIAGQQGTLDSEQERLLSAVFKFQDITTREIMLPRTEMLLVSDQTTRGELIELTKKSGYSRIPVFRKNSDNIQGIFFTKQLLEDHQASAKESYLAKRLLSALFVPESMPIAEVFRLMKQKRMHMAIVVDEFGGTSGLITMEDILEELMGEIQDEQDQEDIKLLSVGKNQLRADARISISDLETELKLEFPEERSYESLGGFLIEQVGQLPAVNWEYRYAGHLFRVIERDQQRLINIAIEKLPEEQPKPETKPQPAKKSSAATAQ